MGGLLGCLKKGGDLRDGREDSYERNPGGVSFVFNHKFFEPFKGLKNLLSVSKKRFRHAERPPAGRPLFCYISRW